MTTTTYDVEQLLVTIGEQLARHITVEDIDDPLMIGIHTGGAWVAERLHQQLGIQCPLASLDISFYRDDFTRIGLNPQVKTSDLETDIENRHIILVDDVLHTGRTIRAALNEIFDYGRPQTVTLVALIERDQRELPICAKIVGQRVDLTPGEHIKLSNEQGKLTLNTIIKEN